MLSLFSLFQAPGRKDMRGLLAQLAEQLTFNQRVVGSSPTQPTTKSSPVGGDF